MENGHGPAVQYGGSDHHHVTWSPSEKKIARQIFDRALTRELDAITQRAKKMAAGIEKPSDLWDLEAYLTKSRKAIDEKYDYRYSQLPGVFARLFQEGRIQEDDLRGLKEDKLRYVRFVAAYRSSDAKKADGNL